MAVCVLAVIQHDSIYGTCENTMLSSPFNMDQGPAHEIHNAHKSKTGHINVYTLE